jgi:acyl-CoA dehydrogenase
VGALDTELAATRMALESMIAFSETAQPGPATTNTIFMHRTLVARGACKTVDLALEVTGGASYHRRNGLERLFRDVQGARFHPLPEHQQRRFAGRLALGLPIDG